MICHNRFRARFRFRFRVRVRVRVGIHVVGEVVWGVGEVVCHDWPPPRSVHADY